ncbi:CRISPR-associated endonuclease Cas6 [Clostridium sp. BSD9I1]|uniref:CRISPR-associated endonuclease Cas6 n=1 Tax=Clostridium sp. BSD9I1 TaxID=2003589 RepID=UPI0016491E4D|nr:CRISPR-associated endonuclease Cas6 [Clostridium sp. BSD9I1]
MKLDICKVTFDDIKLSPRYSEKIRGYLGNKYIENNLLHNHVEDKFLYRYPLVQYKVLSQVPIIIGINEGADIVANIGIMDDGLILDGTEYNTFQKKIIKSKLNFECTEDYIRYKFVIPWIALNQKNSEVYKGSNKIDQEEILKKILIGNIISISKSLGYTVDKKISCWINLKEKEVKLKGIRHIGFLGEFKVNFRIPDYLGIGKSVSKGFGTIKCMN